MLTGALRPAQSGQGRLTQWVPVKPRRGDEYDQKWDIPQKASIFYAVKRVLDRQTKTRLQFMDVNAYQGFLL